MKKTLLQRSAVIAACAAAFVLGSCSQPEEARIDTVYSLDKPEVTAKAYPGMNVISWKPVTGAVRYDVTVYEEGEYKDVLWIEEKGRGCSVTHSSGLVNGKKYTYYVEVKSSSNPSGNRAVVAKNNRGEASVKAIVPPFSTKPLELPAYEKGYKEGETKTVDANDKFVVNSSNIEVAVVDGQVAVTFPKKAYLDYSVKYYSNGLPHEINDGSEVNKDDDMDGGVTNDTVEQAKFTITGPGKYQIAVVANAKNEYYVNKNEEVLCDNLVTVDALNVTQYKDVTAKYVLDDDKFAEAADKKVRVTFEPALQNDNGNKVPTDWYTVYRRVVGEYEITPLEGKISVDEIGKYYIEDEVDVAKKYVYTVVLSHDGKYGEAEDSDTLARGNETDYLSLGSEVGTLTAAYVIGDNKFIEGASKLIRVSFTPAKKDGEAVPTGWHKVYRKVGDEAVFTPFAATVKANDATVDKDDKNVTYYFEDTVSDVTKDYTYKVVVMDENGKYGKTSQEETVYARTKDYINGIGITPGFDPTTKEVTWEIRGAGNAKLSAKYLIVESNRSATVLANDILENGKDVNLAQVKDVNNKVVAGEYTVTLTNPTFTGNSAYIYLVVQATLDGYNTTNVISPGQYIYK